MVPSKWSAMKARRPTRWYETLSDTSTMVNTLGFVSNGSFSFDCRDGFYRSFDCSVDRLTWVYAYPKLSIGFLFD